MPAAARPAKRIAAASRPSEEVDAANAQAIRKEAGGAVKRFYAARGFRPLWAAGGRFGAAADALLDDLESAERDGLEPSSYHPEKLRALLTDARGGDAETIARAEVGLSSAFARYVADQRRSKVSVTYADRALKPRPPKPDATLRAAAFPKSLDDYVRKMGWMSAEYVRLRALAGRAMETGVPREEMARLRLNMDRARLLPGPWVRHIVVDASSGRLWYYEAGSEAGEMRVVVGAQATQTPMLVGTLQWAILDPYWNVPTYLARKTIAAKVLSGRTLASMGIEALSDWSADARPVPASAIDWNAVAAGKEEVRLRERPGPDNSMGRVKFVFPNDEGVYLHDTPDRALLRKDDRHFSNGCIRLEDAARLGRWLLQKPLPPKSRKPEQAVQLPVPVPVYLTYITAESSAGGLAFRDDIYGRDAL